MWENFIEYIRDPEGDGRVEGMENATFAKPAKYPASAFGHVGSPLERGKHYRESWGSGPEAGIERRGSLKFRQ